ncbi:MAG TPA: ribonuclease catalytic domain-containing protein [Burkholderiaceae bacterium]|nr:ribonuclease catalytic domain-containing protein [Burkholderiaceae bacterium]
MTTHLLFEEDGAFKAGTVLTSTDSSHQVELVSGKRTKVKSAHVLLQFREPAPAVLLERAHAEADAIDLGFLWEAAPQDEFGFLDIARDYYGKEPGSVEAASLLFRLHSAPIYFYRKGRGRYRAAPADTLKAALAAVERKRLQDELKQQHIQALKAGKAPAAIAQQAILLLVKPDKNGIEYKAVEQASNEMQTTPLKLLLSTGAIASPYRWHVDSFLAINFPRGPGFAMDLPAPVLPDDLPLAPAPAFSVDDSATTEIDDAFSVVREGERLRVGIHIAAPGVAVPRDHPLDATARGRMSTVYAPGLKYTMLPDAWVEAFSLNEGRIVPVLSLYATVDAGSFEVVGTETRVERVRIAANLRHDRLDDIITEDVVASGEFDAPFAPELAQLWKFARALLARREEVRGRPEPLGRVDYSFIIDGEDERAHVSIKPRRRGAPLDLIVAEMMILANSQWGGWLAERKVAAIYRSQSMGRVRMSTTPAPHEGIGVDHYAWSTSPLRRYVDLVNQRQLIAAARGENPPYRPKDADLYSIVSGFEALYGAYADFQQRMERYWALRWLRQERAERIGAAVIKGDVLRVDGMPFITRLPGLPELPRGQRLELDVLGTNEIDLTLEARVHQVLSAQAAIDVEDDALAEEEVAAEGEGGTEQPVERGELAATEPAPAADSAPGEAVG